MKARDHGGRAGRGGGDRNDSDRHALSLAPRMRALLRKTSYGDCGFYCPFEQVWGRDAAREAHALLAVATVAARVDEINGSKPGPRDAALRRALARLARASRGAP